MPLLSKTGGGVSGATITYNYPQKGVSVVTNPKANLSIGRERLTAINFNNYALFVGGRDNNVSGKKNVIDAYDSFLTRSNPAVMSIARDETGMATVSNYVLIGGGGGSGTDTAKLMEAYDKYFVRSILTPMSDYRDLMGTASIGSHAIFAAGLHNVSSVDAYDSSLTKKQISPLSENKYIFGYASTTKYAIFAGGTSGVDALKSVDAYDSNLTKISATALSSGRHSLQSTTLMDCALFAGGYCVGSTSKEVERYDNSLTRTTLTPMISTPYWGGAVTINNCALIAGGSTSHVHVYDSSFTMTQPVLLSTSGGRSAMAATVVNNYAMFGGGNGISDVIDVYQGGATKSINIDLPVGTKYSFNGEEEKTVSGSALNINRLVSTGYIKYKNSTLS